MNSPIHRITALSLILTLASPAAVLAHGLHGHIHVTGWAIENLPRGELRDFFDDPEVFEAALAGAMFPDTGYAGTSEHARTYGEAAHWEPFIQDFIEEVRATYGPTYTKEEKLVVAFLLGCASHGLQDELFDSTFMLESLARDGRGQEELDPGTDGFLVQDGHARLRAGDFLPITDLLSIYADMDPLITEDLIRLQILVVNVYTKSDGGLNIARMMGEKYRPDLPWASTHYFDASVSGSHRAEIMATAAHMQALWDRLHDRFDEQHLLVHAWPETTRRLRSWESDSPASWTTFILGKGIEPGTATGSIVGEDGQPHPMTLAYTHWGGTSRIVRFQPTADLVPGARYTVTLDAGATLVDGTVTTTAQSVEIQVSCATEGDPACPELPAVPDPSVDTPIDFGAGSGGCSTAFGAENAGLTALVALAVALLGLRRSRKRAIKI